MISLGLMGVKQKEACEKVMQAMKGGDENLIKEAWEGFLQATADMVKQDFEESSGDRVVLAQRGYRQLTAAEQKWYEKLIQAGKSDNPKQALIDTVNKDIMPETIIDDVFKNLVEEHPLLNRISFTSVSYLTKWILNDHTIDTAVWGKITDEIKKEITSAFKVMELTQCKLSAFAVLSKDLLDLGAIFLDRYIREILKDALAVGLEKAVVSGNGVDCPIGLDRDIHEGVSISTTDGYPRKTPIKATNFLPKSYGELLSKMAKSEKGRKRKFAKVLMICNQTDYLSKIMPATTVQNSNGTYTNNIFPFPTDIEISNELSDGEAIICLPEEYFMGISSPREGIIEYSDEYQFLEDNRVFKIKMYGMGKAFDNTVALLIDISELEELYITVRTKEEVEEI